MSVTTSTNTTTQSVLHILADYDLHHSGDPLNPSEPAPPNRNTTSNVENPPGWDTEHRRVPPYRPINQNLDMDLRPGGVNVAEAIFITTMLNGVRLTAVSAFEPLLLPKLTPRLKNINSIWRATGGQLNNRIFRYAIGGEW
jgi:hypothetical protein